jgi:hypothetical protein
MDDIKQFVVLTGNPGDGFEVIGPFIYMDDIVEYTETKLKHESVWVLEMINPETSK